MMQHLLAGNQFSGVCIIIYKLLKDLIPNEFDSKENKN